MFRNSDAPFTSSEGVALPARANAYQQSEPAGTQSNPSQYYLLGPIMSGALNNQATRVGVEKEARLTNAEIDNLRECGVRQLRNLLQADPSQEPNALAWQIASALVQQAELEKKAGL